MTDTTDLPRSVPWPATMNQAGYVALLRQAVELRKAEVRKCQDTIVWNIEEVRRCEALISHLEGGDG